MSVKLMKAGRRAVCQVFAVNTGNGGILSIKSEGTAHDVVVYLTGDELKSLVASLEKQPDGTADVSSILATFL
jgi:hypothetical protein